MIPTIPDHYARARPAPTDPFLIQGPALISFSGGRTSAYMLWRILQAHGGALPDDVVVAFANTGKEREETLRFVHECGARWGVRIHWLEWRDEAPGFEGVGFNSCSRAGEPFSALIRKKGYLPNAVTRFCTSELKVRVIKAFCLSLGWSNWTNIVGLRHDEGHRVMKALAANAAAKERWQTALPLAKAKITKREHIAPFWLGDNIDPVRLTHPLPQGFDLGLRDYEGNCNKCMLKARARLVRIEREQPDPWWSEQEAWVTSSTSPERRIEAMKAEADPWQRNWIERMAAEGKIVNAGARFVTEYGYADIERWAREQPLLIDDDLLDEEHDAECGLWCPGEAA